MLHAAPFTLIELLVVIAIIAVLIALMLTYLWQKRRGGITTGTGDTMPFARRVSSREVVVARAETGIGINVALLLCGIAPDGAPMDAYYPDSGGCVDNPHGSRALSPYIEHHVRREVQLTVGCEDVEHHGLSEAENWNDRKFVYVFRNDVSSAVVEFLPPDDDIRGAIIGRIVTGVIASAQPSAA